MDKQESSLKVPFTSRDVKILRKKLKLGSQIRFCEPILYSAEQSKRPDTDYKISRGTIIGKYQYLAVVRKKDGSLASVTYVELLLEKRKREREKERKRENELIKRGEPARISPAGMSMKKSI